MSGSRYLAGVLVCLLLGTGCDSVSDSNTRSAPAPPNELKARALAALAGRLPDDAAPLEHQVFRYLATEPKSMDMGVALYSTGGTEFLFERLTMFGLDGELLPGAAERWESSEDGKTWTFHLREDARWSDGRKVTAQDFEYTYRRFLHPDVGNVYAFLYYDIKGARAYNQRENTDESLLGVHAVDDHTFVIETEQSCAFLPYITAYHTSSPVPRWQVEKYGDRWSDLGNCISNSAFQLEKWIPGQYLTFDLNPYYEGPNPAHVRQHVLISTAQIGSASSANDLGLLPYENNEIDAIEVRPMIMDQVQNNPALMDQISAYDEFTTLYVYFKTQEPPFDDLKVRRAIAYAIDKETIINVILKGMMIPAHTMLPLHFPGYVGDKYKDIQAYDPVLARKLLAEAGYPGGKGFPSKELWLPDAQSSSPIGQAAQAIQEMLRENLGISIELRNTEGGAYRTAMYNWEIPMSLAAFNYDFPDPQSMLGIIWRSQPRGYTRHDWKNPDFDQLIDQAAGELDRVKRMALYDEAERILATDVGGIFLWHIKTFQLRKPWLKGFTADNWGNSPNYRAGLSYYNMYIGKEAVGSGRQTDY
jgi:oligopeptide transport system substrate-binding protein